MMKKFKQFIAFVLALCMLFSLSVVAFAAEADEHTIYDSAPDEETAISTEAATSGTIQNSSIRWSLDEKGWLTISGSGEAPVFQSADDQPWAAVRDQITEVWFEDVETLSISDLAYWFEGCTNLTTAELPLAPVIGKHAFYNCPKLSTLTMYYGETVLKSIGEDAFWRETDSGDTLYIAYIIGYPEATVPFYTYDWAASNRSSRYFYDLYGVYQNADAATTAPNGIKKAPGISVQSTGSIIGNCPSCGKYSFQGTYVEVAHSSRGHANYNECYACHYVQYLGTYTYKSHGAGAYGSGTCPDCGSHTWVLQSQQAATCTSNGYRSYSCACGQTKSETIYASGHNYSYGSWEQYSSSQHRREAYCRNCGDSDYEYASHSMSYGSWSNSSSSQHSRTASCRTCGYSTTDYGICELEVLEPRYTDDFVLKLLYELINKGTSLRVKLPEGVFDMTTEVHGVVWRINGKGGADASAPPRCPPQSNTTIPFINSCFSFVCAARSFQLCKITMHRVNLPSFLLLCIDLFYFLQNSVLILFAKAILFFQKISVLLVTQGGEINPRV